MFEFATLGAYDEAADRPDDHAAQPDAAAEAAAGATQSDAPAAHPIASASPPQCGGKRQRDAKAGVPVVPTSNECADGSQTCEVRASNRPAGSVDSRPRRRRRRGGALDPSQQPCTWSG
jgi:hypothetical protein